MMKRLTHILLTVATTAVRGRQVYDHLQPSDVARLAEETLGPSHRVAIVFGREKSGLTDRDRERYAIEQAERQASAREASEKKAGEPAGDEPNDDPNPESREQ